MPVYRDWQCHLHVSYSIIIGVGPVELTYTPSVSQVHAMVSQKPRRGAICASHFEANCPSATNVTLHFSIFRILYKYINREKGGSSQDEHVLQELILKGQKGLKGEISAEKKECICHHYHAVLLFSFQDVFIIRSFELNQSIKKIP